MTKNNKKILAILVIIAVMFSAIVFLIPFEKGAPFWIGYFAVLLALVLQIPMFKSAFYEGIELKSKVLGFPVFKAGYLYLAVQTVISIIIFILGATIDDFPIWIPLILCIVVLGLAIICSLTTEIARDKIVEIEKAEAHNTSFITGLRTASAQLINKTNDPEVKALLEDIAERIKFSDPVSNEKISNYDKNVQDKYSRLEAAVISGGDKEFIKSACKELTIAVDDRNAACKLNKK